MVRMKRRKYTSAKKAKILWRHHKDKVPVSQVCEEAGIQPSMFYDWQRKALENLDQALQRQDSQRERELERRIAALEARLSRKDAVIAEISEEYVALKKELGEP